MTLTFVSRFIATNNYKINEIVCISKSESIVAEGYGYRTKRDAVVFALTAAADLKLAVLQRSNRS